MPEVKYRPNIGAPRTPANEEPAAERARDFRPVDTGYTGGLMDAGVSRDFLLGLGLGGLDLPYAL